MEDEKDYRIGVLKEMQTHSITQLNKANISMVGLFCFLMAYNLNFLFSIVFCLILKKLYLNKVQQLLNQHSPG